MALVINATINSKDILPLQIGICEDDLEYFGQKFPKYVEHPETDIIGGLKTIYDFLFIQGFSPEREKQYCEVIQKQLPKLHLQYEQLAKYYEISNAIRQRLIDGRTDAYELFKVFCELDVAKELKKQDIFDFLRGIFINAKLYEAYRPQVKALLAIVKADAEQPTQAKEAKK